MLLVAARQVLRQPVEPVLQAVVRLSCEQDGDRDLSMLTAQHRERCTGHAKTALLHVTSERRVERRLGYGVPEGRGRLFWPGVVVPRSLLEVIERQQVQMLAVARVVLERCGGVAEEVERDTIASTRRTG